MAASLSIEYYYRYLNKISLIANTAVMTGCERAPRLYLPNSFGGGTGYGAAPSVRSHITGPDFHHKVGKAHRCMSAQQAQDQADFIERHHGEAGSAAVPPIADSRTARFELGATHAPGKRDGGLKAGDRVASDKRSV